MEKWQKRSTLYEKGSGLISREDYVRDTKRFGKYITHNKERLITAAKDTVKINNKKKTANTDTKRQENKSGKGNSSMNDL